MIINKSSNYNKDGEFWYDGREVVFQRVWGGMAFVGVPLFSLVVGEENFYGETHYYILVEAQNEANNTIYDQIETARRFTALYKTKRWLGRLDINIKEILAVCNKDMYNSGIRGLHVQDVPRVNEYIDEAVSLIHNLVKPSKKRLHFFQDSMIPSELTSVPSSNITSKEFPRTTALCCALWGMLRYGHDNINPASLVPSPEGLF